MGIDTPERDANTHPEQRCKQSIHTVFCGGLCCCPQNAGVIEVSGVSSDNPLQPLASQGPIALEQRVQNSRHRLLEAATRQGAGKPDHHQGRRQCVEPWAGVSPMTEGQLFQSPADQTTASHQ